MSEAADEERRREDQRALDGGEAVAESGVGSENDLRYRAELRRGFCWRCVFAALLPALALLAFGWWAYSNWSTTREEAALELQARDEQIGDLETAIDRLDAELRASEAALREARRALIDASGETPESIALKLAALPDADRGRILSAYDATTAQTPTSEPTADAVAAALNGLDAAERAALYANLSAAPAFESWFAGLTPEARRDWVRAAPSGRDALAELQAAAAPLANASAAGALAPEAEAETLDAETILAALADMDGQTRDAVFRATPTLDNLADWLDGADDETRAAFFQALPDVARAPIRDAQSDGAPRSLAAADARIDALAQSRDLTAAERDAALAAAEAAVRDLDAAEAALEAARAAQRELEAERDALAAAAQDAEADGADLAALRERLRAAEAARDAADAALAEATDAAAAERDASADAAAAIDAERAAAERALADAEARIAALTAGEAQSAADAAAQTDALRQELAAAQARLDDAAARNEELRLELARRGLATDAAATPSIELAELRERAALMEAALEQAALDLSAAEETTEEARRAAAEADARAATAEAQAAEAEARVIDAERVAAEAFEARDAARASFSDAPDFDDLRGQVAIGLQDADDGPPAAAGRLSLSSNVAFATGEAELSDEGREALDRVAAALIDDLSRNPDQPWLLVIEGHTDRRGISTEMFPSNWELSTARAAAVARYLSDQGVPAERIVAAGRAEFDPIDPAPTAEAYRLNRRIEFEFRRP